MEAVTSPSSVASLLKANRASPRSQSPERATTNPATGASTIERRPTVQGDTQSNESLTNMIKKATTKTAAKDASSPRSEGKKTPKTSPKASPRTLTDQDMDTTSPRSERKKSPKASSKESLKTLAAQDVDTTSPRSEGKKSPNASPKTLAAHDVDTTSPRGGGKKSPREEKKKKRKSKESEDLLAPLPSSDMTSILPGGPLSAALSSPMISPRKSTLFMNVANMAKVSPDIVQSTTNQIAELQSQLTEKQNVVEEMGKKHSELADKQRTIDSLMEDLRNTTNALRVCGSDIVSVREENTTLKKTVRDTEERLRKMQIEMKEAFSFVEEIVEYNEDSTARATSANQREDPLSILNRYDHESLVLIASELGKKLRVIELDRIDAKRYATDAKASKNQLDVLSKTHKELQEAHLQQAKFIQKLQKQNAEVQKYRETIKTQENVIAKMQKLVERRLKPPDLSVVEFEEGEEEGEGIIDPKVAEEVFKLNLVLAEERNRYSTKENELIDAMREINKLKEKIWELETGGGNLQHVEKQLHDSEDALHAKEAELLSTGKRIEDLSSEVSSKEMRIAALEEQLVLAAQSSAKEISKLRTRIFELEVAMTSIENDPNGGASDFLLAFEDDFKLPDFSNLKPMIGVEPPSVGVEGEAIGGVGGGGLGVEEGVIGVGVKDDVAAGSAKNAANSLKSKVPNLQLDTTLEPIAEETPSSRRRRESHRRSVRHDYSTDSARRRSHHHRSRDDGTDSARGRSRYHHHRDDSTDTGRRYTDQSPRDEERRHTEESSRSPANETSPRDPTSGETPTRSRRRETSSRRHGDQSPRDKERRRTEESSRSPVDDTSPRDPTSGETPTRSRRRETSSRRHGDQSPRDEGRRRTEESSRSPANETSPRDPTSGETPTRSRRRETSSSPRVRRASSRSPSGGATTPRNESNTVKTFPV